MEGFIPRPSHTEQPTPLSEAKLKREEDLSWQPHDPQAWEEHGAETIRHTLAVLQRRKEKGYSGYFEDGEVVVVMVGPGAMRGSQSAAFLSALVQQGLHPYVDYWIGSSAGAHNIVYAATGQAEAARFGYVNALAGDRPFHERFINMFRWLLRLGPAANLSIIKKIYPEGGEVPLNWPEVMRLSREGRLGFVMTNEFGESEILSGFEKPDEIITALIATSYLPHLSDHTVGELDPPKLRGRPYFDGGIAHFLPIEKITEFITANVLQKQQKQEGTEHAPPITGKEGAYLLPRINLLMVQGSTKNYMKAPKMDTLLLRCLWRLNKLFGDLLIKIGHGSFSLAKQYPGVAARQEGGDFQWEADVRALFETIQKSGPDQDIGKVRDLALLLPNGEKLPLPVHIGLLTLPPGYPELGSFETNAVRVYNNVLHALHQAQRYLGKNDAQLAAEAAVGTHLKEPLPSVVVVEGEEGFIAFPYPGTAPWERFSYPTENQLKSIKAGTGRIPSPPPSPSVQPTPETIKKAKGWTERAISNPDQARTIIEYLTKQQQEKMAEYPKEVWEYWQKHAAQEEEVRSSPLERWRKFIREGAAALLWGRPPAPSGKTQAEGV